jgi:uncharacterized membrane protein YfcA
VDVYRTLFAAGMGFVVSVFSVTVGGTSLITVPMLIWLGVEPRTAVATNRFGILFLSLSGTLTFVRGMKIPKRGIIMLHALPVVAGSALGAALVMSTPQRLIKVVIAVATIVISVTLAFKRDAGVTDFRGDISSKQLAASMIGIFPLAVYGGFFGGGFATLITYLFVFVLGFSFLEGAAATRLVSIFLAAAASIYLAYRGVIDFPLGLALAAGYLLGAHLGARLAMRRGSRWVKALFIIAAIALSLRLLGIEIHSVLTGRQ